MPMQSRRVGIWSSALQGSKTKRGFHAALFVRMQKLSLTLALIFLIEYEGLQSRLLDFV